MKVWITKYALTVGIIEAEGVVSKHSPGMVSYHDSTGPVLQFAHGNDWHTTERAAFNRAEEMRQKKIASLKKQIKKLEGMQIEVKP
ncbi:hypothetical protein A9978_18740 [Pseudomonas sp. UMC65]|uniref:hypothetical protein n=1 Tax=Pseudomonas sp. UMC65 TaxID=1862323 RepID=UPI001603A208|nr:hypothetical protein [Pseudomonas sp. UMC65]MBB1614479.1 hypothetical protein [Pseudomonas sp. UMC65]